jgi:hypothetical protein
MKNLGGIEKKMDSFNAKIKNILETNIAKNFKKKILKHDSKKSISSTIFYPSNPTMWLFTLIQFLELDCGLFVARIPTLALNTIFLLV